MTPTPATTVNEPPVAPPPFTMLGGILYLDETSLLADVSADCARDVGRLRRAAVRAHKRGDTRYVKSCATRILKRVERDRLERAQRKNRPTPKRAPNRKNGKPGDTVPGRPVESGRARKAAVDRLRAELEDPKRQWDAACAAWLMYA